MANDPRISAARDAGVDAAEKELMRALAKMPHKTSEERDRLSASTSAYTDGVHDIVRKLSEAVQYDMDNPSAQTIKRLNTAVLNITGAASHDEHLGRALKAQRDFLTLSSQDAVLDAQEAAAARNTTTRDTTVRVDGRTDILGARQLITEQTPVKVAPSSTTKGSTQKVGNSKKTHKRGPSLNS